MDEKDADPLVADLKRKLIEANEALEKSMDKTESAEQELKDKLVECKKLQKAGEELKK